MIEPVSANAGAAAGAIAAQQIAVANAIRASGALVHLAPEEFTALLARNKEPLVVISSFGVFETWYRYLMPYRGLVFWTDTPLSISLPPHCEVVNSQGTWVPQM